MRLQARQRGRGKEGRAGGVRVPGQEPQDPQEPPHHRLAGLRSVEQPESRSAREGTVEACGRAQPGGLEGAREEKRVCGEGARALGGCAPRSVIWIAPQEVAHGALMGHLLVSVQ